ncbi:MAG: hypothetical protein KatS3mg012_1307 [Gaiellaceae bacterium]|nr:MAG: hypothetical protein KatS3mg012_1307 [Gaiellaceae bacterium]
MGNHYHLLAQTLDGQLSRGMRQLNGVYAQWLNRRHGRVGHVFQGRYVGRLVQADGHVLASARYIVRNPVAVGLCARPSEWPWSSCRATLGVEPDRCCDDVFLLSFYGTTEEGARRLYREHVEHGDDQADAGHPLVVGDDAYIRGVLERLEPRPGVPERYRRALRPPLRDVLGANPDAAALDRARDCGYSLREIAREVGVDASTISRRLRRQRALAGIEPAGGYATTRT